MTTVSVRRSYDSGRRTSICRVGSFRRDVVRDLGGDRLAAVSHHGQRMTSEVVDGEVAPMDAKCRDEGDWRTTIRRPGPWYGWPGSTRFEVVGSGGGDRRTTMSSHVLASCRSSGSVVAGEGDWRTTIRRVG